MTELNNPLISIVTPVYNREELIIKAIQSVENQTYQKWEYLIIDDGSTDKTWDTIQAYAQLNPKIIPYQREQQPKGAQTCRNLGLSKANGKYIIFLDSDDYLLSHCLEQRVNYLTNLLKINLAVFPEIKLQYTDIDNFLLSFLAYRLPLRIMDSMWETTFLKNRWIQYWVSKVPRCRATHQSITSRRY